VRIYLFEDFARAPLAIMRDLFQFLEVDPGFVPEMSWHYNRSGGVVSNGLLRRAWVGTAPLRARVRPFVPQTLRDSVFRLVTRDLTPVRLDPTLRAELTGLYRGDIERLAALIDRDLSHWLEPSGPVTGASASDRRE
jgi:hypothetical protein